MRDAPPPIFEVVPFIFEVPPFIFEPAGRPAMRDLEADLLAAAY